MAWTSKPSVVCSATMMPDSHSAPTPTPLGRCSKRLRRKWAVSWLRFDKSHRQAEHRKGNGFLSGALWLFPHSSLCGSRCGSELLQDMSKGHTFGNGNPPILLIASKWLKLHGTYSVSKYTTSLAENEARIYNPPHS